MGIATSPRLTRLLALRDRLDDEIKAERLPTATDGGRLPQPTAFTIAPPATPQPTHAEIRAWARAQGHDVPATGRVSRHYIDLYNHAHTGDTRP